ncbi:MAG: hypothetical protein AAGI53_01710 [Planctomycetota bacterium]
MAKQLSIVIKAIDQATAPIRGVITTITRLASVGKRQFESLGRVVGSLTRRLTSLPVLLTAAFGVFAGGQAVAGISDTARQLQELGNAAQRTTASVESLSFLLFLGRQFGAEARDIADLVGDLNERIAEGARLGTGAGADAIKRLGLEVFDANGVLRSTDELIDEVITKINALPEAGLREFFAKELLADEGARFLAFFTLGTEELERFRRQAEALGVIFTEDQVAAAVAFREALSRVGAAVDGVKASIIGQNGQGLADVLDAVAVAIAAAPEVIGNIVGLIRQNLDGVSHELLEYLTNIGTDLGGTLGDLALNLVNVAFVVVQDVLPGLIATLGLPIAAGIAALAAPIAGASVSAIADGFAMAAGELTGVPLLEVAFAQQAEVLFASARRLGADVQNELGRIQLSPEGIAAFGEALSKTTADLGTGLAGVAGQVDSLLGVSEALRRVGFDARTIRDILDSIRQTTQQGAELPSGIDQLIEGASNGLAEIKRIADDVLTFADGLVQSTAQSLSANLASGFIDAAEGAKTFGEAMREALTSTLRLISQTILQFAILRAISGIASSVSGGTDPVNGSGVLQPARLPTNTITGATLVGPPQPTVGPFNTGGRVPGVPTSVRRVLHAANGAFVRGPNHGVDSVLGMLTPGEFVLSRRAVGAQDPATLAAMQRGERIRRDDRDRAASSIVVEIHAPITITGAANEDTVRRLPSAIADQVVAAIEQNPQLSRRVGRATARVGVTR